MKPVKPVKLLKPIKRFPRNLQLFTTTTVTGRLRPEVISHISSTFEASKKAHSWIISLLSQASALWQYMAVMKKIPTTRIWFRYMQAVLMYMILRNKACGGSAEKKMVTYTAVGAIRQ